MRLLLVQAIVARQSQNGTTLTDVYNPSDLMANRRILRRRPQPSETILWARLRNRQVNGLKFRRQYGIGDYIVDFYCQEA